MAHRGKRTDCRRLLSLNRPRGTSNGRYSSISLPEGSTKARLEASFKTLAFCKTRLALRSFEFIFRTDLGAIEQAGQRVQRVLCSGQVCIAELLGLFIDLAGGFWVMVAGAGANQVKHERLQQIQSLQLGLNLLLERTGVDLVRLLRFDFFFSTSYSIFARFSVMSAGTSFSTNFCPCAWAYISASECLQGNWWLGQVQR